MVSAEHLDVDLVSSESTRCPDTYALIYNKRHTVTENSTENYFVIIQISTVCLNHGS